MSQEPRPQGPTSLCNSLGRSMNFPLESISGEVGGEVCNNNNGTGLADVDSFDLRDVDSVTDADANHATPKFRKDLVPLEEAAIFPHELRGGSFQVYNEETAAFESPPISEGQEVPLSLNEHEQTDGSYELLWPDYVSDVPFDDPDRLFGKDLNTDRLADEALNSESLQIDGHGNFGVERCALMLDANQPKFFWETDPFLQSIFCSDSHEGPSLKRPDPPIDLTVVALKRFGMF